MFSLIGQLTKAQRLLMIGLLALVLAGVQLVQSSSLHEHASHSVDCALCHLQFNEITLDTLPVLPDFAGTLVAILPCTAALYPASTPTPYQSRAPPASHS